jgi:uncharacterized membrane protein
MRHEKETAMNALTSRLALAATWVVVVVLLYQLVPATLSMTNFLFVAAVLLLLVAVVFVKGRRGATHESMTDVLMDRQGRKP